jgi:hypothetical protein
MVNSMGRIRLRHFGTLLILSSVVALVVGCSKQVPVGAVAGTPTYMGALSTSYENALDAASQLALGTLRLEGTEKAVTEGQAASLLVLWQALQGTVLQGSAERTAVIRQIEDTMTATQVAAISGMRLTQEDAQAWVQSQGPRIAPGGGQTPGGRQGSDSATGPSTRVRGPSQNVSPEELATRRAQWTAGGQNNPGSAGRMGFSTGSGTAAGLTRAVIGLLTQRSGQRGTPMSPATATPPPTATPGPDRIKTEPAATVTAAAPGTSTPQPAATALPTGTETGSPTPTASPTESPAAGNVPAAAATRTPVPAAAPVPTLAQVKDTSPGPPFTVEISLNRATQDPLVETSRRFKITGLVRNDGDETYAVSDILVTFYDAEGFRGTFVPAIRDGKVVGGEWLWHGQIEADFACLLLAPGEACPFVIEITAQNMASFLIHPDAAPTERESVPVALGDVRLVADSTDYLRITGTATNSGSVKAKNVTVSGVLLDESEQIVSVGATYVLQEEITPGESVRFDLRVEKEPYVRYLLYAQAERDWD